MEKDPLKWLRGPLPPLSESILQSGLIHEGDAKCKQAKSQLQLTKTMIKKVQPQPSVGNIEPNKSNLQMHTTRPRETLQSNYIKPINITPQAPNPKPQTVEMVFENPRIYPDQMISEPKIGEKQLSKRDEIAKLNKLLDDEIRNLESCNPQTEDERTALLQQYLKIHNSVMNELILQDKSKCSDRALLLRRLQCFYQSVIDQIPKIASNYHLLMHQVSLQMEPLKATIEAQNAKIESDAQEITNLKEEERKIREKADKIIETSNDKDIKIQSLEDSVIMHENNNTQLLFKIKKLKDEIAIQATLIDNLNNESKKQLESFEKVTEQLRQYQNGDASIVSKYQKSQIRNAELEKEIERLNQVIYDLCHIEKNDKCVDTADLPQPKKKKRKQNLFAAPPMPQGLESVQSGATSPNHSAHISAYNSVSNMKAPSIMKRPSFATFDSSTKLQSVMGTSSTQTEFILDLIDEETQTENEIVVVAEPQKSKEEEEEEEKEIKERMEEVGVDEEQKLIKDMEFANPSGYEVPLDRLKLVPDIFPSVIPFFSEPCMHPEFTELNRLNVGNITGVKATDKPFVWGLQILHNFLIDPFIRSDEAKRINNLEEIFFEWATKQYKLNHIINQVCAEVSVLLYKHCEEERMMKFFFDLLQNKFSYTQLCFISTLYTFSVNFTYPSVIEAIQDMQTDQYHERFTIHIMAANHILGRCMIPELAEAYMRPKAIVNSPMIDYADFLTQSAFFFQEKHRQLYSRTNDLLLMCGIEDVITFKVYNAFMCLVDKLSDHRNEWDMIKASISKEIDIPVLIQSISERRKPLVELLCMGNVTLAAEKFSRMKQSMKSLYSNFLGRYTTTMPAVIDKLPSDVVLRLKDNTKRLRRALLDANMSGILWYYRIFLVQSDMAMLRTIGSIPFEENSSDDTILSIIDFYDMAEKIAFSLIE